MSSKFTSELTEGMVTLTDTFSTTGKLILQKNTVITKSIINMLVNNDVIFVDVAEDDDAISLSDTNENSIFNAEINLESITNTPDYKMFKRRYEKQITNISEHINDIVNRNAPVDADVLLSCTTNILKSTQSPLSIFTMLSTLKDYDDSTFNHSLNVSLICNIFARWLGLSSSEIELLTLCGLLHDVGKLLIPNEIIKKPGKLTEQEFKIIKTHPQKGYELLKKRKADLHVQYAALMHHEKCDGSGYPLGMVDNQIDWVAQIITIADIYEAMTSNRVYRGALSPFSVINMFEEDGLKKYNPKFLLTFLEHVVNSYMNCKVKLSNGVEGDIVYINKVSLSKPLIKTNNEYIDLSKKSDIKILSILE